MQYITNYTKKRYITYFIITLIIFILPFVRINNNHFFLLDFINKKLNLFFISFDTQELYLMPFMLMLLFIGIFFITTLAGRIWCAWSCPQTIFRVIYRDLIQTKLLKIRKNINNKQKQYPRNFIKKIIAILIFYIISLIAISNFLWYFVPPEIFFSYLANPQEHLLLIGILLCVSLFLTLDVTWWAEKFCIYVCPYARIQSVMFDHNTMQVIYDEKRGGIIYKNKTKLYKKPLQGDCIGCEACVDICPTHIDIRKGMQLECINCLECADACSKVQNKLNRPSLIEWTSIDAMNSKTKIKFLRFKTIGYLIVLLIILALLILVGSKKEKMLLNINRNSELYSIDNKNGKLEITNAYTFLFQNTDNQAHEYYFEIETDGKLNSDIEILRPKKPFKLEAGAKTKKIIVLKAKNNLNSNTQKDIIVPITIKAYAVDDNKIFVYRKSIFIYPKKSEK